jgi:hypothetical protein
MERLVELVRLIETSNEIKKAEYLTNYQSELIDEASVLAESLFITSNGHCNWENIEIAQKHNIFPYAVERDRFGWLTGGFETDKGIILYG